jgi:hypothetical protein
VDPVVLVTPQLVEPRRPQRREGRVEEADVAARHDGRCGGQGVLGAGVAVEADAEELLGPVRQQADGPGLEALVTAL